MSRQVLDCVMQLITDEGFRCSVVDTHPDDDYGTVTAAALWGYVLVAYVKVSQSRVVLVPRHALDEQHVYQLCDPEAIDAILGRLCGYIGHRSYRGDNRESAELS